MTTPQRNRRKSRSLAVLVGIAAITAGLATGPGGGPVAASGPADWPIFDHDNQHTALSTDASIAASTAAALTVKWKTGLRPGVTGTAKIWGSPTVVYNAALAKNVVYITDVGNTSHLTALDAATGAVLWFFSAAAGIESSATVSGNTVYFGSADHYLYAVNATTGAQQCRFAVGGVVISSPVVANIDGTGDLVFFGDAGLSESANLGHEWAVNGVGNSAGSACTSRWAFNQWHSRGPKGNKVGSWSSPALAKDPTGRTLVVFGSSNPDDSVYALNASNGGLVWRFQTQITAADQDVGAPPTIGLPGSNGISGHGLVFVNGKDKIEYALDLVTGAMVWQFNMVNDAGTRENSISSTALVDQMVVVNYWEYTYALSTSTGAKLWRSPARTGVALASPSISGAAGDRVVFTGDLTGNEYAYKLTDGTVIATWSVSTPSATVKILSSPAIANGMVFFGSADDTMWALAHP